MNIVTIQKMINWSISIGLLMLIAIYSSVGLKGAGSIVYRLYRYSTPRSLVLSYNKPISSEMEQQLKQGVLALFNEERTGSFSIQSFSSKVCSYYPYIKELTARITPAREVQLQLQRVEPHFIVNNSYVLSDKRRLFDKNLFEEERLQSLGQIMIQVDASNKIDTATYDLFHSIPSEIYDMYVVSYTRPTHITLIPKNKDYCYRVIADATTLFDEKKRQALAKIAEDVIKRNSQVKNKQGSFVLDMRFKKGIIVKRSA